MMVLGLRLKLTRDYASKFLGDPGTGDRFPRAPPDEPLDVSRSAAWHVLGRFDRLQFERFDDLDLVDPTAIEDARDLNLGSVLQLLLFPLDGTFKETTLKWLLDREDPPPFLIVIYFTLSAIAHEQGPNYKATSKTIRTCAEKINKLLPIELADQCELLTSFGAPDLVLVARAELPSSIVKLSKFVKKCEELSLSSVLSSNLPGHVFASVLPIFGFQNECTNHYNSQDFRTDERHCGIEMYFRMRLDCGHRSVARDRMKEALLAHTPSGDLVPGTPIDERISFDEISWDEYSLRGSMKSFLDLSIVSKHVWFDPKWRINNLVDTETSLVIPGVASANANEDHGKHSGWQLTHDLKSELDTIHGSLENFCSQFLRPPQSTELMGIFHAFRSCFFRHALIGAGRDLLPFFRQLAFALDSPEVWNKFFRKKVHETPFPAESIQSRFATEMRRLLNFVGRAVRNRIDFRTLPQEMSFPHTLDHGACKLVGAYSTVFYLCWELVRRRHGAPAGSDNGSNGENSECNASYYAACICSGVEGRIICTELFRPLRRYVEENEVPTRWSSRLLLVDISGKTLMRPEFCFVHCLHESAEVSRWIMSLRARVLQQYVMEWIKIVTASYIVDIAFPKEQSDTDLSQEEREEVYDNYASKMIKAAIMLHLNAENDNELLKKSARFHPEDFVEEVEAAFLGLVDNVISNNSGTSPEVRKLLSEDDVLPTHESVFYRPSNEYRKKLHRRTVQLRGLIRELVADIGMWSAFSSVPGFKSHAEDERLRLKRVHMVFGSILQLWEESSVPTVKTDAARETILLRWKIQAMAVSDPSEYSDGEIWKLVLEDQIRDRLAIITRVDTTEDNGGESLTSIASFRHNDSISTVNYLEKLASWLRSFTPYGGKDSLQFPVAADFGDSEIALYKEFVDLWEESESHSFQQSLGTEVSASRLALDKKRIAFVNSLWAKSGRLRYSQALVSLEQ